MGFPWASWRSPPTSQTVWSFFSRTSPPMLSTAERFEAKLDRSGEHHGWTAAKKVDSTGVLQVNGKLTTAARVARELASDEPGKVRAPSIVKNGCPHPSTTPP